MAPESACQRAACSDVEERRFSAASKRLKRSGALAPEGAEPSLRKLFSRAVRHCETIRAQAPEDRFHLSQTASRWLAKRVTPSGSRPPGKPVSTTFSIRPRKRRLGSCRSGLTMPTVSSPSCLRSSVAALPTTIWRASPNRCITRRQGRGRRHKPKPASFSFWSEPVESRSQEF
jgi:hypothetical protein